MRFVDPSFTVDMRQEIAWACYQIWPDYPSLTDRLTFVPIQYRYWVKNQRPYEILRIPTAEKPLGVNAVFQHPNYLHGLALGRAVRDDGTQFFANDTFLESYEDEYPRDSRGVPVHPYAETMLKYGAVVGPGFYWQYGPNRTADPVVLAKFHGHLYWLAILREDYNIIALPGGHEEPGSTGISAALRELLEETGVRLTDTEAHEVYRGVVADERATLNAWPESKVYLFNPEAFIAERLQGQFTTQAGETRHVMWRRITIAGMSGLFASHASFIKLAVLQWQKLNNAVVDSHGKVHR